MGHRSVIPDLLFRETREERVRTIAGLYCRRHLFSDEGAAALHRATVFATHRCNFKCVYCNGPQVSKTIDKIEKQDFLSRDLTPEIFSKLLDEWKNHGLKHIHFTGGEATLNKNLPMFVRQAFRCGILSSLTTNGSAPPAFYRELVEAGLREIRISIDSHDPDVFEKIVRVPGSFSRVRQSILELVKMRDNEKKGIFIIFNICLQAFDLEECKETLERLLEYRPDDMKILVIAEDAKRIEEKASRRAVDELLAIARRANPAGFELLERKIHALFRKDSFGLKGPAARHLMKHCFIPLTERTVDGKFVYPCSIYVRYRGEPLAFVTETFAQQQMASEDFSENHHCGKDPICSANCTACCRDFNIEANRRVEEMRINELSKKYPVLEIPDVSDDEVLRVRAVFHEIHLQNPGGIRPFFIVKPLGVPRIKEILQYLTSQGVGIRSMDRINNWQDFALYLYLKERAFDNPGGAAFKIAINRGFRRLENIHGYVLWLEKEVPFRKIYRIKSELRKWFGDERRVMQYKGERMTLQVNAIHAPDEAELAWQNKVIEYFVRSPVRAGGQLVTAGF